MSDLTHLMHLKQYSIEHWNHWRQEEPDLHPDLSHAFLCAIDLAAANLSDADLHQADLYSADLWGADLSRSDLRAASLGSANLSSANLSHANLTQADLSSANLSQSTLTGANLSGANLSTCHLNGATLTNANLTEANLKGANLTDVVLTGATLTGATLTGVVVSDLDIQVVESLFQQLSTQSAQVPPDQRPKVVGQALQKKALSNPAFKARLLKALESGSGELVRVFAQNPYISVPLALVKGWMSVSPAAPKAS
jgi:uncharacterized protein YjbI with pentapeptide repeats